jgi:NADH:ubiquinone reductase (non-electrogenic)
MRWVRRATAAAVTVTCGAKLLLITANDEWGDVYYSLTNLWPTKLTKKTKVVVLGSGWAALSFIQKLDPEKVELKVISPRSFFFYTPLLAGTASGTVCSTSIIEPIRWHLERFSSPLPASGSDFFQGECTSIDFLHKQITCTRHEIDQDLVLSYDHLVIAIGAEPATFNIPGVRENAIFMKEIENGLYLQNKILEILEHANTLHALSLVPHTGSDDDVKQRFESEKKLKELLHWVVIGGGPTGVELTAELNDFIRNDVSKYFPHLSDHIQITLLEATGKILGMFDPKISEYAQKTLVDHGARVMCGSAVTKMTSKEVELKKMTGEGSSEVEILSYGLVVWAGGITARPIAKKIAETIGCEQLPPGRPFRGLLVGNKFQVKGLESLSAPSEKDLNHPCVWAIGDCAVSGCPPTAQAAFQQGNYLGRMLRDTNFDSQLIDQYRPFEMRHYGAMAYLGASQGVAELKGMLWDQPAEEGGKTIIEGTGAFALWRSLYFSRLLSNRNKAQVIFDWFKASVFGRDISSPYNLHPPPAVPSLPPASSPSPLVVAVSEAPGRK